MFHHLKFKSHKGMKEKKMIVQSAVETTIKTQPVTENHNQSQNSMYQQDFSAVPEPITGGRNYPYNVPAYRQQAGKGIVFVRLVGPSQPFTSYGVKFGMLCELHIITGIHQ